MWLLSSDGEALGGKQRWLRPGTHHLFGRTSSKATSGEQTYIQHESISRKHITLHIGLPELGDGARPDKRSAITATESSKKGTIINGRKYVGEEITFDVNETEYILRLASSPDRLKIEWKPVVLSIIGLSKADKKPGTASAKQRHILELADIKVVYEYRSQETTHVVCKSRNTPAALQGLLQARWVLAETFVVALVEMVQSRAIPGGATPLEDDFNVSWPKEREHIAPTGTEPVKRQSSYLEPDLQRAQLFQDHTFIFLVRGQYEKLLPVLSLGQGKCHLCELEHKVASAAEVVAFTKRLAGHKDEEPFLLSQQTGPWIVLVRPEIKDDIQMQAIIVEIERAQNQRMIDQKAFLDVILAKDITALRRNISDHNTIQTEGKRSNIRSEASQARNSPTKLDAMDVAHKTRQLANDPGRSENESVQQVDNTRAIERPFGNKRRRIITTQSRAKFGDDYDPAEIIHPASESPEPEHLLSSSTKDLKSMNIDSNLVQDEAAETSSRKRSAPSDSEDGETEDQNHDRMYPHQAALAKRLKMEERKTSSRAGQNAVSILNLKAAQVPAQVESRKKVSKRKAMEPEPEIKQKLQARVRFDEEQRLDEEAKADMSTMTAEELKQIAEGHKDKMIVNFEVLALENRYREHKLEQTEHPEWTGRKNFKKFRSSRSRNLERMAGNADEIREERPRITLVPVPGKSRGTGTDYWLERSRDKRESEQPQSQGQQDSESFQRSRSRLSSSAGRRQAAVAAGEVRVREDEDDGLAFRRRLQRSRDEDIENEKADSALAEPVRAMQAPARSTASSTQTMKGDRTQSGRVRHNGKRPAGDFSSGDSADRPNKKVRQNTTLSSRFGRIRHVSDDEDDDPTAFRRTMR